MSSLRKSMVWSGLFLFSILCVHAFLNSIAAVIAFEPEHILSMFSDETTGTNNLELNKAIGDLVVAQRLSPGNTRYLENAATIKLIEAGRSGNASGLVEAQQTYIDILNSRPIWPYTWINFLRARAQSATFDRTFDESLSYTFSLVSLNEELYLKLLHLGLEYWFVLSANARYTITQSIEQRDVSKMPVIRNMLKELSLTDFVCASLGEQAYERVCV